jgi:hypothetical protein
MRKIISCFVSISCFFSFCFTAYATEREYGQTTSIPDIIAEAEQISEIAEKHNDYTLLSSVAERFYENVMPTLTEGEIVNIIEDSSQNNLYKSMVIDLYSLANDEATLSATVDNSVVDASLASLVIPNGDLSIMAMTSLADPAVLSEHQLKTMIHNGNNAEQVVSLKLLCNQYAEEAYNLINSVLFSEQEETVLYDAAINFIPRLIGKVDNLTEESAISLIRDIMQKTHDEKIKITCIQALMELGTPEAINVVCEEKESLPFELVRYFYENVDMENELLSEYIDNESMLHAVRGAKNRLGNALYRDGVLGGLEWHAGLVGHANGPMYNGGAWVIHHPGPDNVVEYGTFTEFLDGNNDKGELYKSSVSQSTAYDIFYTAHDLTNEGIAYSYSPMLRSSKSSGKIHPSDITKIRCDGVVEYCYEYNGVRLQGPDDSTNTWDISTAFGADYHPGSFRPSLQAQCFDREVSH